MADPGAVLAKAPVPKKDRVPPPSPPLRICDRGNNLAYTRTGFLGEGGFARVYEVLDSQGDSWAVKVVTKSAIRSKKSKTKLWAEIKLHQMLQHPNVVSFRDCFEDEDNVYMLLELCDHGSMMDFLRRRRQYTEPEARFYLVQLVGACQYMHDNNVIHRDLKLGNLFLDRDMNIKVGDFGLAALIEKPGDRKKTICGTPNYIAPEVLFDTANGHSFEVDIWSVGVILYTLLIGRPPFQTKDVKAIYKRIRENRYEFPADKQISNAAMDLIMQILNTDPEQRPSLETVLAHPFFLDGPFPSHIPKSANDVPPDFRHISATQSRRNFERARAQARVGSKAPIVPARAMQTAAALGPSILQQERDFRNAVQPDSPISALLNSARQPLVQASTAIKEPSLLRKLTAASAQSTLSPVRRAPRRSSGSHSARTPMAELVEEEEDEDGAQEVLVETDGNRGTGTYDGAVRHRELAAQKARIVSAMTRGKEQHVYERDQGAARAESAERAERARQEQPRPERPLRASPRKPAPLASATTVAAPRESRAVVAATATKTTKPVRLNVYETCLHNLDIAFDAARTDVGFRTPNIPSRPPPPSVFVVSWLDYCQKYGMGFTMNDGCVAVHFNDSSSMVISPAKTHVDYIAPNADGAQYERRNYAADAQPRELTSKLFLVRHFDKYMAERLVGKWDYQRTDAALVRGMVFVMRYLRMKHVIVFRLSNDVLQFNFYDHTKLILSTDGLVVSIIDKHNALSTWSLEALLAPLDDDVSARERKMVEGVLHKLQYARDVLDRLCSRGHRESAPTTSPAAAPAATQPAPARPTRDARRPIRT
ncbi:Cell cycle serine/threonine-protein kinase cdc5/MSD2 [Cryptotrichosporon argae]